MAITWICECGQKLAVKDELAGKRVKCPACTELVMVPSLDVVPPRRRAALAADDEDEQHEDRPKKKKKAQRRDNTMLWIGAGAGVVVLGLCCLGVVGGVWIALSGTPTDKTTKAKGNPANSRPEQAIHGAWVADATANKNADKTFLGRADHFEINFPGFIEFRPDGTVLDTSPLTPILNGRWRVLPSNGAGILSIEMTHEQGEGPRRLDIKVIDSNHLRILEVESRVEVAVKRA
jgi:hypothetical protein